MLETDKQCRQAISQLTDGTMKLHWVFITTYSAYSSQLIVYAFTVASRTVLDSITHSSKTSLLAARGFEHEHVLSNITTQTTRSQPKSANPSHIAFICDGNSRWSSSRIHRTDLTQTSPVYNRNGEISSRYGGNVLQTLGHAKGAARVVSMTQDIKKRYPDIRWITMYTFSTENWTRSVQEIEALWQVMEQYCDEFYSWAVGNLVIKVMGDLEDDRIPISLRERLKKLEFQTNKALQDSANAIVNNLDIIPDRDSAETWVKSCDRQQQPLTLCIAVNYGGRKEIVHATRQIAQSFHRGELKMEDIDEERFDTFLSTSGIPAPELIIRTGGEQRLSNFLLWQSAYAELYFTNVLWPDFDETCLDQAIQWYTTRDRRFGSHP